MSHLPTVHLQLEYKKKTKWRQNLYSKAHLNEFISLISSALVLLKETKQLFMLICYQNFKKSNRNNTVFSVS